MTIVKRSLSIRGHRTSISIEDPFWERLRAIARERDMPLARLVGTIDSGRSPTANLSSAIRLFVLDDALSRRDDGAAWSDRTSPAKADAPDRTTR